MKFQYNCPKCKSKLTDLGEKIHCKKCSKDFFQENNYINFDDDVISYVSKNHTKIKELLFEIKQNGYQQGIEKFLISNKEFSSQITNTEYDKSVDSIFHGLGKNFSRCLDINGELGNKAEILSKIFEQVFTIEQDEKCIEFQKIRFKEKKCTNVILLKCDFLKLPFPDNYFDIILCNGILDNITKIFNEKNQQEIQKQLILELKRVITNEGCIIFGVSNKKTIKIKWKESKNNPNVISNQKFSEYFEILKKSDLNVKSFWAFPSYNIPFYSGEMFNEITLKGFFNNFENFISILRGGKSEGKVFKTIFYLYKKTNFPLIKNIIKNFVPSFVFCCWKTNNPKSLESWIKKETGYQNLLRMSRHEKNMFMLLNDKGDIKKGVYVKRQGKEFPEKIKFFSRNFPDVKEPTERIWMVNWLKGRLINQKSKQEIYLIINWLIEFQKKNKLTKINKKDIFFEIDFITKGLEYFHHTNLKEYFSWLKQYQEYFENNQIFMTPTHGDFWFPNVLYDSDNEKINIIDWETFSERGNPYEDFIWFTCNLMGINSTNPSSEFKLHLEGKGEMKEVLEHIKNQINLHFGFELDYLLLIRVNLLKWMIIQDQIREKDLGERKRLLDSDYLKILRILSEKK
jgi:ubiquinone/menaquinone biosynthesis C-methylase UbiE